VTPLHLAAREGHAMMVQLLLYWGANPDARDNEGRDALYYARYGNHRIIETMILKARKRKRAKK
jgi:ankyrin repeat protein